MHHIQMAMARRQREFHLQAREREEAEHNLTVAVVEELCNSQPPVEEVPTRRTKPVIGKFMKALVATSFIAAVGMTAFVTGWNTADEAVVMAQIEVIEKQGAAEVKEVGIFERERGQ